MIVTFDFFVFEKQESKDHLCICDWKTGIDRWVRSCSWFSNLRFWIRGFFMIEKLSVAR